ncbi:MAG: SdpI family protein [Oscillospiraceae bacterium]|nr:SdpI family protein [Oscillospiraceae bacterium]
MKYISKKLFLIPLLSLLIAAMAYPQLPEQIPIHFDFSGTPDNYSGKLFIFVTPALSLLLTAMAELMPKADPKKESYEKFPKAYQMIHVLTNLLLLGTNMLIIAISLGYDIDAGTFVMMAVGILFIIIVNYMPKFKQSFFCGIKTPWALADEENWYKTHRMSGRLWMIGGFVFLIVPFLNDALMPIVLGLNFIVLILLPYLYSYWIFRKKFK